MSGASLNVLAEATLADIAVPNGSCAVTFLVASPATVVARTSSALVVTRPGSDKLAWRDKPATPAPATPP